ncbi:MAG: primase, partial [Nocardioidaceae bacterium]|nr:primase [Nocardioidaceae bacterium]
QPRPAGQSGPSGRTASQGQPGSQGQPAPVEDVGTRPLPDLRDPRFQLERETLKLVVQQPALVAPLTGDLGDNDFTHPTYRAVWRAVSDLGGPSAAPEPEVWVAKLRDAVAGDTSSQAGRALNALVVEPVLAAGEPDAMYAVANVFRLQELTAMRRIADLKSRLQRTNPVDEAAEYNRMFGELVALESHRRNLRERAIGATD